MEEKFVTSIVHSLTKSGWHTSGQKFFMTFLVGGWRKKSPNVFREVWRNRDQRSSYSNWKMKASESWLFCHRWFPGLDIVLYTHSENTTHCHSHHPVLQMKKKTQGISKAFRHGGAGRDRTRRIFVQLIDGNGDLTHWLTFQKVWGCQVFSHSQNTKDQTHVYFMMPWLL